MVYAHGHAGTLALKCAHYIYQARVEVTRFLEVAVRHYIADSSVHEVGMFGVFAGKGGHVIVGTSAERAGAECQAVVRVGHSVEECLDVDVAGDYAWQAEDGHWWIIGVHAHVDVIFIAYGHDGLKEVSHVCAQGVGVDSVVEGEELAEFVDGLEVVFADVAVNEALGLDDDVVYEAFLTLGIHAGCDFLCHAAECLGVVVGLGSGTLKYVDVEVGEFGAVEVEIGSAVGVGILKVGACPVEYGHEVIAYSLHASLAQVGKTLFVAVDKLVAVGAAVFYRFAHRQAFYNRPTQTA